MLANLAFFISIIMNTVFYAGDCVAKDSAWAHHYYEQTLSVESNQDSAPASTNFECLMDSDDSDFLIEFVDSFRMASDQYLYSAFQISLAQRASSLFRPPKDQLI